jgi:hypothetical protein
MDVAMEVYPILEHLFFNPRRNPPLCVMGKDLDMHAPLCQAK